MDSLAAIREAQIGLIEVNQSKLVTDGLILHLDALLNDGLGKPMNRNTTVWKDLSANGQFDAVLLGSELTSLVHWDINSFKVENAHNTQFAWATPAIPWLETSLNLTLEILYKPTKLGSSNYDDIVTTNLSVNSPYCWGTIEYAPNGKLAFGSGENARFIRWSTTKQSPLNVRATASYTIEGPAKGNCNRIAYFNGSQVLQQTYNRSSIFRGDSRVSFGGNITNPGGTVQILHGNIYGLRLYNRALIFKEIQQNYIYDRNRYGL